MHKFFRFPSFLWLAALMLAACSQTPAAPALGPQATLTVTDGGDSGDGTLRSAIAQASAGDHITFAVGFETVTLASELVIDKDLTIAGPYGGSVTVSGNNSTGVFRISADTTVELHNLTITDGYTNSGVYNAGTLTVMYSTISGNNAVFGGGILNTGTLTVTNSTVSGNSASFGGGGIFNSDTATLTVTNGTISGNSAAYQGGGISSRGSLTVTNSTISGNSVIDDSVISGGGGIRNQTTGTLTLSNSIVALNSASNGSDIIGSIRSGSNNIVGENPGLELDNDGKPKLADNGGSTKTLALLAGSPALDAADGASCPATDQRGVERPQGSGCDIGAFELEAADTTPPTITLTTPTDGATYTVGDTVTASYNCADEGGSGLESCAGPVADGSALDTSTPGSYSFTVEAKDNAGNTASVTHGYTVAAPPEPVFDRYTVDAEGLSSRIVYGVRVGQGMSGPTRPGRVSVGGQRVIGGTFRDGQTVKALDLWGGKRLAVMVNDKAAALNPGGAQLQFTVNPFFTQGLATVKSITLYNVVKPGMTVNLYRGKTLIKKLLVPVGRAGGPVTLTVHEPGVSIVSVFARFPFAVDDLVFELPGQLSQ